MKPKRQPCTSSLSSITEADSGFALKNMSVELPNSVRSIKVLLAHGVDVNAANSFDRTESMMVA